MIKRSILLVLSTLLVGVLLFVLAMFFSSQAAAEVETNPASVNATSLPLIADYAVGAQINHYVDRALVYGQSSIVLEPEAAFSQADLNVVEGNTATVTVQLDMEATFPVTVSYTTEASQAGNAATLDRDYTAASGTLVFAPGVTEQSFNVTTLQDSKYEGQEGLRVRLYAPVSLTLGSAYRARLLIQDDDLLDPTIVDDFVPKGDLETFPYTFETSGTLSLDITEIAAGSGMALPGQLYYEHVLSVTYGTSRAAGALSFGRAFAQGQDWSGYEGLTFWYYGGNSGTTVTVKLLDNRVPEPGPEGWELVWTDEFNGAAGTPPDPTVWRSEIGDGFDQGSVGWGNGEYEYYTGSTDNAALDGAGHLVITASKVDTSTTQLECWYGMCEYTSARLVTKDRLETAYGWIEARLKLPYSQGIWPKFWMLGNDIGEVGWPTCGEIDVIEHIGREPNTAHGDIHGPGYSGGAGVGGSYTSDDPISDDYHVFAIEWQPELIRWYVDETNFFTATVDSIPAGTEWVFDHPAYLIMNVAVGGNWPGDPDETTVMPQTMYVDYVHVYQAGDSAERFEATFVDDFTGWQLVTIPFSSFTHSAWQPEEAPDDGLTLTEVWGYGFELPASSSGSFYMDMVKLFRIYRLYLPLVVRQ
jgi:beta-glucanase (GH16 family)